MPLEFDKEKEVIEKLLVQKDRHPVDICFDLVDAMEASEHPAPHLQQILEYSSIIGGDDEIEPVKVSQDEINVYEQLYFSYIVQYTRILAEKNLPQEDFYKKLFEDMFSPGNGMLPTSDTSKAILLETLANHVRCVPYYQLRKETDVSDEEFDASIDCINGKLLNAKHILQRSFDTKTQEGIQLYRILESIENERDRVVFLSLLISIVRIEESRKYRNKR